MATIATEPIKQIQKVASRKPFKKSLVVEEAKMNAETTNTKKYTNSTVVLVNQPLLGAYTARYKRAIIQ
jgi:hypothetical protein